MRLLILITIRPMHILPAPFLLVIVEDGACHQVQQKEGGDDEPEDVEERHHHGRSLDDAHLACRHEVIAQVGSILPRHDTEKREHGLVQGTVWVGRIVRVIRRDTHKLLVPHSLLAAQRVRVRHTE